MRRLFAVLIAAERSSARGTTVEHAMNVHVAESLDQAVGEGYSDALREWPRSDGWRAHDVKAGPVPEERIREAGWARPGE